MLLIGKTWKPAPAPRQVHDVVSLIRDQGFPQCNQNVKCISCCKACFGSRNPAKGIGAVILLIANLGGAVPGIFCLLVLGNCSVDCVIGCSLWWLRRLFHSGTRRCGYLSRIVLEQTCFSRGPLVFLVTFKLFICNSPSVKWTVWGWGVARIAGEAPWYKVTTKTHHSELKYNFLKAEHLT